MSYELLIAEKPNAALRIATALADKKLTKKLNKRIPYYELKHDGKDIVIASAVGHLYGLKEKIKNGWSYPTFSYEWRPIYEIGKKSAYTKDYIETIKKLSKDASLFTVSTDYDDEGTVLGLNVIKFACNQDDANRMKFSTLTKNDLVDAYNNKLKHLDWGQANAGLARHVLDWEFGINLSRALTLAIKNTKGGFKILSTGRVQGPALKIIVERHKEIINFKPEPFWLIQLIGKVNSKPIEAWHKKDKLWNQKEAEEVIEKTKNKTAIISDLKTTRYNQLPPPPFDLTSLQIEAYRALKVNPQETLSIAQNLYLAGLISYPRTSSQQIPSSINLKEILEKLSKQIEYRALCKSLLSLKNLVPNNGKKTDPAHPACIPTGEQPKSLKEKEKKLYDLIVKRTLATLSSPANRETSEIEIDCNKEFFLMKGTRTVEPGWHKFYQPYTNYSEEELPKVEVGQKIEQLQIQMHAKETQPPKRYTPASIIKELEKHSLGTKSTRAQIIDTLYQRHYIQNQSIEATNLGISTIEALEKYSQDIVDEKLTRHFEKEMQEIQESKKTKEKVIEESEKVLAKILKHFKENEQKIGQELIKALYETRESESLLGKCPKCDLGELKIKKGKYGSFISCSRYEEGCNITFSLPSSSLIKPTEKSCESCLYPLILSIRKGKKPQELCFNDQCPTKKIDESKIKSKKCPKCKAGNLVLRKSIYGAFLACDKYPKCYYKESLQKSYKQSIPEKMQVDT